MILDIITHKNRVFFWLNIKIQWSAHVAVVSCGFMADKPIHNKFTEYNRLTRSRDIVWVEHSKWMLGRKTWNNNVCDWLCADVYVYVTANVEND